MKFPPFLHSHLRLTLLGTPPNRVFFRGRAMKNKPLFIESSDGILTLWTWSARYPRCLRTGKPSEGWILWLTKGESNIIFDTYLTHWNSESISRFFSPHKKDSLFHAWRAGPQPSASAGFWIPWSGIHGDIADPMWHNNEDICGRWRA